ncbi:hypothetical protein [Clostridium sp. J1101437_171009_A5]|uniref:hypothetical protein n=1 Tax=Clostridium sp. J1101437_171009_A5 TaxID=2787098 RepID=UPI001899D310|nr:hypothetical protein [Clostridium sp. J1101437_171009_A5]
MNRFINFGGLPNISPIGLVKRMRVQISLRMLLFIGILGVLCCGMTACGLSSENLSEDNNSSMLETDCKPTDSPVNEAPNILNRYESILKDNASYFSVENGENMTLAQSLELSEVENLQITQFALVDFDHDQIPELILKKALDETDVFGYEVLHEYGEDIYGYSFTYRNFADLKIDGTFVVSSSAYDYGIGKLEFSEDAASIQRIAESETLLNEDGTESVSYAIDGETVPEEDFFQMLEQQDTKKPVVWNNADDASKVLLGDT